MFTARPRLEASSLDAIVFTMKVFRQLEAARRFAA